MLAAPLWVVAAGGTLLLLGLIQWARTIRRWVSRGSRGIHHIPCQGCPQRIWRTEGDWLLRCYNCGWKPGWPGVRWLTHSVPSRAAQIYPLRPALVILGSILLAITIGGVPVTYSAVAAPVADIGSNLQTNPGPTTPNDTDIEKRETDTPTETPTVTATEARIPEGDADQDGLSNRAELRNETDGGYPLPSANPYQKDLYLRIYYEQGTDGLTAEEIRDLESIWASMPVSNPNGNRGIALHVQQEPINTSLKTAITEAGMDRLEQRVYEKHVANTPAACTVYVTALVNKTGSTDYSGRGAAPGYLNIVARGDTEAYDTEYTVRTTSLTHELLHNTVGELPNGEIHTQNGWLRGTADVHGSDFYLSNRTASQLSERGFSYSEYYQQEVCYGAGISD